MTLKNTTNNFSIPTKKIQAAAKIYGTPTYIYDFNKIDEQFNTLKNCLPNNFTIHYAFKTNSNLAICKHMASLGSSADISSIGELYLSQKAGFHPKEVIFTGPGKTNEELLAALDIGCGFIVVESINEAKRLNDLAKTKGVSQDVLLRINPLYRTNQSCELSQASNACVTTSKDHSANDHSSKIQLICHPASKFGVDEEKAEEEITAIQALPHLQLKGIHIFTETNVLNYNNLLDSWKNTILIANQLRTKGYPIYYIDFGGGIGIPYNAVDEAFNMAAFGAKLQKIFDENPFQYNCLVEIGRYIVGESGCYVTEVVDIKKSRGKEFVILNGGVHQLFRISPSMVAASKYLEILDNKGKYTKKVTLVGKLPTALDVFVENVDIPEDLSIGDHLVIFNCGAYGFNHSLSNFILHPYPAEVAYNDGQFKIIRNRGSVKDFLINQEEEPV